MEWKDITIKQYQDICKEIDEDYSNDLDRTIGILSALTGMQIVDCENLPISELKKKLKGLDFIKSKPKPMKLKSKVKVGKRRFRFNLNMRTISAGQYIDLTELVKDNKKINDNLHLILGIMCKEVNIFGIDKKTTAAYRAEYFRDNLTMDYVFSLSGFFLSNYQRSTKAISVYLDLEMKKAQKIASQAIDQALSNIGDGITL